MPKKVCIAILIHLFKRLRTDIINQIFEYSTGLFEFVWMDFVDYFKPFIIEKTDNPEFHIKMKQRKVARNFIISILVHWKTNKHNRADPIRHWCHTIVAP